MTTFGSEECLKGRTIDLTKSDFARSRQGAREKRKFGSIILKKGSAYTPFFLLIEYFG